MTRIGIIGTDNGHALIYSALINGWREDLPLPLRSADGTLDPTMHLWAQFAHSLDAGDHGGRPAHLKVTSIWSADPDQARQLSQACGIEHVCDQAEDATNDVDAVMVLSEDPADHFNHARPALERGLPTYIDKPLTPTSAEAREIFDFAEKHRTPCFTGSSARYSPELLAVRDTQQRLLGPIHALYIHCPITIPLYVSHALEMMNLFIGHDIESVEAIKANNRQLVLLQERSGITTVIDHVNIAAHPRYSGTLHGRDAYLPFTLTRLGETALAFIKAFARFVATGEAPTRPEESLAIMRLTEAILTSLQIGRSVAIR